MQLLKAKGKQYILPQILPNIDQQKDSVNQFNEIMCSPTATSLSNSSVKRFITSPKVQNAFDQNMAKLTALTNECQLKLLYIEECSQIAEDNLSKMETHIQKLKKYLSQLKM
ncbi:Hypothetical_protein [Hexamita inflata]|uniref:Hypothetical_protein n=1 Tax=Hexamita inflata TaxID=28002 RepID=A0AA86TNU7_9EUKA|nr:Hypothetical protein HINF_LOCUS9107 [Hexamita inflata]CAI9921469.1 Hypothetical protein HINF_LOCUS9114 [Hexamita inflata]